MSVRPEIRWGVIGCGQIAIDKSISGLLHAECSRLVAVADPLVERRELALTLAAERGNVSVRDYDDVAMLLDDPDVDAVYISLPTGMHAEVVAMAARAGKAILCEKPMGRSAAEVAGMVREARAANVPLMTAYMSRFGDPFREAVRLVADGRVGRVTFVSANFSYPCMDPYPPGKPGGWRWTDPVGGGALLDIGVYLAFGLREILGDRVARVGSLQCDTIAPPEAAVPDTTVAWFRTDGGIPGTFAATFSHAECSMTFYGTRGRLDVRNVFSQSPTGRVELTAGDDRHVFEATIAPDRPHFDNYRREFAHFSAALLRGEPHRPSADEALTDALLLDALARSGAITVVPTADQFLEKHS